MSHTERPPVEPLSDVAWSRVERGVWSRLDEGEDTARIRHATPRRWWLVATPFVAAAAAALLFLFLHSPSAPRTTLADAGPTRIVSEASPSSVSLGDAHIALDPQSAIVMSSHDTAPNVIVEQGAAWFSVEPRGSRPPFVVLAGDTRVRVIGTRFKVARSAERVQVTVDHGIVEIGYHGDVTRVTNGQVWSSDAPSSVIGMATPEVVTPEIEMPEMPATPQPLPTPKLASRPAQTQTATAAANDSDDRDALKYAELARLEASSPDAAMAGYLALAKGSGRWAPVALYAAGRLAADRHETRAATFLDIYLRRFPHGANADDARQLLGRLKGTP